MHTVRSLMENNVAIITRVGAAMAAHRAVVVSNCTRDHDCHPWIWRRRMSPKKNKATALSWSLFWRSVSICNRWRQLERCVECVSSRDRHTEQSLDCFPFRERHTCHNQYPRHHYPNSALADVVFSIPGSMGFSEKTLTEKHVAQWCCHLLRGVRSSHSTPTVWNCECVASQPFRHLHSQSRS